MFSSTAPLFKSSSSRTWLARQFRDPFVKQRMQFPSAFRSRAAFKLLQIDAKYRLFEKSVWGEGGLKAVQEKRKQEKAAKNAQEDAGDQAGSSEPVQTKDISVTADPSTKQDPRRVVVIDLGAAPGGWSQVVASKFGILPRMYESFTADVTVPPYFDRKEKAIEGSTQDAVESDASEDTWSRPAVPDGSKNSPTPSNPPPVDATIIALDILPISPIRGVTTLRQDFLSPDADGILSALLPQDRPKADVILSDIAVNMSGNPERDQASAVEVLYAVYHFAKKHLRREDGEQSGGWLV